ncbi:MAG: triose-phosphate isomerase [Chloroflexi bacterium]|nr:triose-phosphate isomerase [Chloroflexota bacterium]
MAETSGDRLTRRQPIVAGNWKMNTTLEEGLALVDALLPLVASASEVERVVCPPFISLASVARRLRGTEISVGAQNLYFEPKGAFTGEISAQMLVGLARYVIVGHSERRHILGESDEMVARKVRAAFGAGILPILCVGETLDQRRAGQTEAVLRRQVRAALDGLEQAAGLVIAYEPVWAIGTGHAATAADANLGNALVRDEVAQIHGRAIADATRVQYGGSVTPDNAAELLSQPEVDGALVGGASLKAESFAAIVRAANDAL